MFHTFTCELKIKMTHRQLNIFTHEQQSKWHIASPLDYHAVSQTDSHVCTCIHHENHKKKRITPGGNLSFSLKQAPCWCHVLCHQLDMSPEIENRKNSFTIPCGRINSFHQTKVQSLFKAQATAWLDLLSQAAIASSIRCKWSPSIIW